MRVTLLLATLALATSTTGCATARALLIDSESPQHMAEIVDNYCAEVPELARLELRAQINARTTRCDITVTPK